jgi:hypothetical protein
VCRIDVGDGNRRLAAHLHQCAAQSDGPHVMWLNRTVTKERVGIEELATLLDELATTGETGATRVRR